MESRALWHAIDCVSDSLNDRRRLVTTAKSEPFGGSDWKKGDCCWVEPRVPRRLHCNLRLAAPSGLHWAFRVCCLADWSIFSRADCLTCSLDSTSLHRGYVGCAATLADSLLAATSARVAGSCSPWVSRLFSLIGAACRATFTARRRLRVACMLAMSIDAHATH